MASVSHQGFQIKMAEQDMRASSPSTAGKATRGCFAGPPLSFQPFIQGIAQGLTASPPWCFLHDQQLCPGLDLL